MIWDRLAAPWRAAIEEACDAYRAGTNPVGAVVCDAGGNVIARGRNRILDRRRSDGQLSGTRLAHAEVNALLRLPDGIDARDLILYATVEPCPLCIGAIVMSRVRGIRYASRDPWAGAATLLDENAYIRSKRISCEAPRDARLERALKALSVEALLRRGERARAAPLLAAFSAVLPESVAAGERLFATGELHELAQDASGSPALMLDLLDRSVRLAALALKGPSTPMPPQETALARD